MDIDMKVCTTCKIEKEFNCFNKDSSNSDGLEYGCRSCRNLRRKELYQKNIVANKIKSKNKSKQFRMTRKDYTRNYDLKRFYGIDSKQFDEILEKQNYRCKICNTDTPKGKHNTFAVDHCHNTGKIRGLLCNACNVGLGSFRDCTEFLENAIKYLKKEGH